MKKNLLLIMAASLLLVSCSNNGTSQTEESNSAETGTASVETSGEEKPTEDVIITYAVNYRGEGRFYDKYIERFNEMDNGYKIEVKNYNDFADETAENSQMGYALADMQLNQDIIKGDVVDLVSSISYFNFGYYDIMEKKGAFVDLNTMMANDTDFDRSELHEHVLSLYENDGNIFRMPMYFVVETLAGPAKYVGEKENWTVDEMIEHYNAAPENVSFNMEHDKYGVFMNTIRGNLGSFIDYEKGTANFDDPEFIKILEFCNRFGESSSIANDVDRTAPLFLRQNAIYSFQGYHMDLWEFSSKGDECTFVGYPSDDGCGAFIDVGYAFSICLSADDDVKRGAWEFIKMMTSEEVQNEMLEDNSVDGLFPINNKSFEKSAKDCMGTGENIISMQGTEYDIGYLTEEEYERLITYINNTKKVKTTLYTELYVIIDEEVRKFFNGEYTAEEAAAMIQNRASIMVSEKAG